MSRYGYLEVFQRVPCITKTSLYNFDPPLTPLLYSKTGVYRGILYFSYFCSAEAVLTSTHNLCFEQKYEKYQSFLTENFQFLEVKFSTYFNMCVFVMGIRDNECRLYLFRLNKYW